MLHVHPRLYDVNLSPYRPEILAKPVSNAGNTPLALAAELKLRVQVYSRCFRAASSLTDALMVPSRLSAHQYTGGAFPGSIPPFHEHHQIILKTIPVFAVPDSVFCQILVFQGDAAHKIVSSGNNDRKELRPENLRRKCWKCLCHKMGNSTANAYRRTEYQEERKAVMQRQSDFITESSQGLRLA